MLNDLVAAHDARIGDFLNRNFVRKVIRGEVLQERNRSYLLYSFLVLEMWLRSQRTAVKEPELLAVA
jgi:hypothetical protein